jgi:hypothetical protein
VVPFAVTAAAAEGGADFLTLFERVQRAWETGGLAFVFFIGLALFFTGRIFTARDRERMEKQMAKLDADWKTRYDENDRRWERQLEEVKARSSAQEGLLYQMMGMQREATMVAKQATSVAQQATSTGGNSPSGAAP